MSDAKNPTDNPPPGNGVETDASFDVSNEIQKLQEQAEKYKNDYLYLRAEFENFKKHMVKERSELIKFGCERLARDLLGVLDNFERALATGVTAENFAAFRQGVDLTASELRSALGKHGVAEVKSEGLAFDPAIHEALSSEGSAEVAPGNILRVFQKGYTLHEKLIRPAQVVVAKKPD